MLKIEITDQVVDTRRGTSQRTQKPYVMHEQKAWATFGADPYPTKVKLIVEGDENGNAKPYPMGMYELAPESLYADGYGNIKCSPKLVRVAADIKKAG